MHCLAAVNDICGEGAVWHPEEASVYWTDINRRLLHRYALSDSRIETWQFDEPVTSVALTQDPEQLLIVLGGQIILWSTRFHRHNDTLFQLPTWSTTRCNDARVGPDGSLWFGTMQNNVLHDGGSISVTQNLGELLCLEAGGRIRIWHADIGIANTIAWSPSGDSFYFGDTLRNVIYTCGFDRDSGLTTRAVAFAKDFPRGLPDGSAMDSQGYLWNCRYGGSSIVRFAPDGSVAEVIEVPIKNPTTCAFGGPDLKTLYVTSAIAPDTNESGLGGALFCVQMEVTGLPSNLFRL